MLNVKIFDITLVTDMWFCFAEIYFYVPQPKGFITVCYFLDKDVFAGLFLAYNLVFRDSLMHIMDLIFLYTFTPTESADCSS